MEPEPQIVLQMRAGKGLAPLLLERLGPEAELVTPDKPEWHGLYAARQLDGRWEAGACTLRLQRVSKPPIRPVVYAVELHRDVVLRSSEVGESRRRSTAGEPLENCKLKEAGDWELIVLVTETNLSTQDVISHLAEQIAPQPTPEPVAEPVAAVSVIDDANPLTDTVAVAETVAEPASETSPPADPEPTPV